MFQKTDASIQKYVHSTNKQKHTLQVWLQISTIKQTLPILIRAIQDLLYYTPAEKTVESTSNFCFLITAVFIPAFFIGLPNPCRQANEREKPLK